MHRMLTLLAAVVTVLVTGEARADEVDPRIEQRIREAAPDKPYARPQAPRTLLVFTLTRGYRHDSIPTGVAALRILGEKTGAFTIVHSEDVRMFQASELAQFDAVCLLNTTGELFRAADLDRLDDEQRSAAELRESLLMEGLAGFVERGKGLVGIHAATDTFYEWRWYGEAIGGYFDGHPWHEEVTVRVEEPGHPLNACCTDGDFTITDEIYQFREPYSRDRLRVLWRLDTDKTDMRKEGIKRTDRDFAISWVRTQGRSRVFYCALGHRDEVYWNPKVLRHYLAGIQFALGDLEADTTPRPAGGGDK